MASMKHRLCGFRGFRWQSVLQYLHLLCPAYDTAHLKGDKTYEKQNFTAVSTIMLFIPWTILPLRSFDWALKSPAAEIMILSYAAFMIFSGIFSILVYTKGKVKSKLMQVCVAINSIYAVGAIAIVAMSIPGLIQG